MPVAGGSRHGHARRSRAGIDTVLNQEQRDQLVRIASSLSRWTALAHVVVQRLAGRSHSARLARALRSLVMGMKSFYT